MIQLSTYQREIFEQVKLSRGKFRPETRREQDAISILVKLGLVEPSGRSYKLA